MAGVSTSEAGQVRHLEATWEADKAELERSERVRQQLLSGLEVLEQRRQQLRNECERLARAALPADLGEKECRLQTLSERCREAEELEERLAEKTEPLRVEFGEHVAASAASRETVEEARAQRLSLQQDIDEADARASETHEEARTMVSADVLERLREGAQRLNERLVAQEAENAELTSALVDAWAARADPSGGCAGIEELDGVEEQIRWLSKVSQSSTAEVYRVQHMERAEQALQSQLRSLSEEKAILDSARVDLGDAGKTMREAMASQSEGYVRRVVDLEGERRLADQDRVKLLQECATLQGRLASRASELDEIVALEVRRKKLVADEQVSHSESRRMREVNAALGALLILDGSAAGQADAPGGGGPAADEEPLARLLRLQYRLVERRTAHVSERDRLVDRIRELEREAMSRG